MAKAADAPTPTARRTRGEVTRQQLIEAAIETLKNHGYAGASARVIADRAGVNQGLVFYHFESVTGLLLAALDEVSAQRRDRYAAAVDGASSPADLVRVASTIYREDLDAGYVGVLVAMIAGAATTPGLGDAVAERIAPWTDFARIAVTGVLADSPLGALLSADDVGFAVVALYLGMEMLTHLDGDRAPATSLFDRALRLATLVGELGVGPGVPGPEGPTP